MMVGCAVDDQGLEKVVREWAGTEGEEGREEEEGRRSYKCEERKKMKSDNEEGRRLIMNGEKWEEKAIWRLIEGGKWQRNDRELEKASVLKRRLSVMEEADYSVLFWVSYSIDDDENAGRGREEEREAEEAERKAITWPEGAVERLRRSDLENDLLEKASREERKKRRPVRGLTEEAEKCSLEKWPEAWPGEERLKAVWEKWLIQAEGRSLFYVEEGSGWRSFCLKWRRPCSGRLGGGYRRPCESSGRRYSAWNGENVCRDWYREAVQCSEVMLFLWLTYYLTWEADWRPGGGGGRRRWVMTIPERPVSKCNEEKAWGSTEERKVTYGIQWEEKVPGRLMRKVTVQRSSIGSLMADLWWRPCILREEEVKWRCSDAVEEA